MSGVFSRMAAPLALAACTGLVMAAPAEARGGWGHHRYRHHDRVDAGDVIAGIAVVGVIAAIASAASNSNRRTRDRDANDRYQGNNGYQDWRENGNSRYQDGRYQDNRPAGGNDEAMAVDGCVSAAETRGGSGSRVDVIRSVERAGDGWRVTGSVLRDGRAEGNYATRDAFDCGWDGGQVSTITVEGQR